MQEAVLLAVKSRALMKVSTNALRLVNGAGDGCPGLLIDCYYKHVHIQILEGPWVKDLPAIEKSVTDIYLLDYLIVKQRQQLEFKVVKVVGQHSKTIIEENRLKFIVDLNDGMNVGLFLDMRANRLLVGKLCKAKKVLNCFAYTCSFGVYARAHGAREVVNVDISPKILERGRANYEANQLPVGQGEFVRAESVGFLMRQVKKGNAFDVIILDPPSFARHEGTTFQVKRDLPKLVALSIAALSFGGILFVSTNCSEITHGDLERMLALGLNGRKVKSIKRLGQDKDFVGTNTFKESYLAALLVELI